MNTNTQVYIHMYNIINNLCLKCYAIHIQLHFASDVQYMVITIT